MKILFNLNKINYKNFGMIEIKLTMFMARYHTEQSEFQYPGSQVQLLSKEGNSRNRINIIVMYTFLGFLIVYIFVSRPQIQIAYLRFLRSRRKAMWRRKIMNLSIDFRAVLELVDALRGLIYADQRSQHPTKWVYYLLKVFQRITQLV